MSVLELVGVGKAFPDGTVAVDGIDLEVAEGELLVLVGPSGSGKTTLLRLVAGLEEATRGTMRIGGRDVAGVPPHDRDIAMVFQSYALYPQMTVAENMGFALKLAGLPRAEIRRRVGEAARLLGLEGQLDRRPRQLSGGQRQRVAMGRALVRQPVLFLMDEPLSNLDAQLRVQMRAEIRQLQLRLGVTTLHVTHDQTEAMTMGDRVAVMRDGRLEQVASPQELYERPANVFVGRFIGSPAMNLLIGALDRGGNHTVFRSGAVAVPIPALAVDDLRGVSLPAEVVLGVRPEHLHVAGPADRGDSLAGTVVLVEHLGAEVMAHVEVDARAATPPALGDDRASETAPGDPGRAARLVMRLPPDEFPALGQRLPLAPDPRRLHLFDARTGLTLRRAIVTAAAE